jgi:8-oxo-dGTP pyrophosphatase MutT (NUDIX family)
MKKNVKATGKKFIEKSGVIPYRKKDGKIEVLLVTTIRRRNWIIPKGFIEANLSPFLSAKKEAFEEAGVRGSNSTKLLGSFTDRKNGTLQLNKIYSMKVTRVFKSFPEKNLRKRKWFSVYDAAKKVNIDELATIIRRLGRKKKDNL